MVEKRSKFGILGPSEGIQAKKSKSQHHDEKMPVTLPKLEYDSDVEKDEKGSFEKNGKSQSPTEPLLEREKQ